MLTQAQFNALISKKRQTLLRQQAAVDATTAEIEMLTANMQDNAERAKQLDIEDAAKGKRK